MVAFFAQISSMVNVDKYLESFKLAYNDTPENMEKALLEIRQLGASPMESLRVLMVALNLSIPEADNIILNSETWSDEKDNTISLREYFQKAWSKSDND